MALKDKLRDKPVIGTVIAVQERYADDLGNQLAGSMAFFMFLSIFPILLAALAMAGFFLQGDPAAQQQLIDAVTQTVPGLGEAMGDTVDTVVDNRRVLGVVGFLGVVFAGLRVVDSAQVATSQIYRYRDDANPALKKVRALGHLVVLGLLAIAGAAAAGLGAFLGDAARGIGVPEDLAMTLAVVGPIVAFALDLTFFLVAYRLLAVGEGPSWRDLWPGALLAAIGWTLLKLFGAAYVGSQAEKWNELLGTLGSIIAAMLLLFLAGRIYVLGAELNAVRCEQDGRELFPHAGGSGTGERERHRDHEGAAAGA
ncbi:MAG: YihY/virulence factor BrkB family protein [Actinobacteria bacterium]|nr:YihY/virulence factor BrkB family protein [Actinomycetota bacterium]